MTVRATLDESHIDQLLQLFVGEWWTAGRRPDDIRRMLAASAVVVCVVDEDRDDLVGFARAISDETYLAVVLDVIVAPVTRGQGVGRLLVDTLLAHPKIAEVNSVELVCQPTLVSFYERWGFTTEVGASRLMRRSADPALVSSMGSGVV
jgi:predicted GNAT family N-acyltransferase